MPEMTARLCWALPVHPHILGAHLEAYVNTQPIITALRLCHRYGKGDKAAVGRLPVELIASIEEHVMEDERKKLRRGWKQDYACWQAKCKVLDHFTLKERVDLYEEFFGDCWSEEDMCPGCGGGCCFPLDRLTKSQAERLADLLEDEEMYDGDVPWIMKHKSNRSSWQSRVGEATEADRGIFTKHAELISKNFRLNIWLCHTQLPALQDGQRKDEDIISATLAYLVLPANEQVAKKFERRAHSEEWMWEEGPPYLPSETGYALPVSVSEHPSKKSLRRFPRAMKLLNLRPMRSNESVLSAIKKDAADEDDDAVARKTLRKKDWRPKLTFLMAHKDNVDDLVY